MRLAAAAIFLLALAISPALGARSLLQDVSYRLGKTRLAISWGFLGLQFAAMGCIPLLHHIGSLALLTGSPAAHLLLQDDCAKLYPTDPDMQMACRVSEEGEGCFAGDRCLPLCYACFAPAPGARPLMRGKRGVLTKNNILASAVRMKETCNGPACASQK